MKTENYDSLIDWLKYEGENLSIVAHLETSIPFSRFCGVFDIAMEFGLSLDTFCQLCNVAGFSPELIGDVVSLATQKRIENHFKEKNNDNVR